MNSTKFLQRPHKITSQFLPRSLTVSPETTAFLNCRVKGFYLKKLLTYSQEDDNFDFLDFKSVSHVFRNKKIHKTLIHAEVCSDLKPYVHYCLKTIKNLKTYALEFYGDELRINSITLALRRLPAKIQKVHFQVYLNTPIQKEEIYEIARSLRRFPKLQSIQREFIDYTDENKGCYIQKELALYCQSVTRLKEVKRMTYCLSISEYHGLQRAMRRGFVYRGITGLELSFWRDQNLADYNEYLFLDFENMTPNEQEIYKRIQNEIKEEDKAQNDDIDWSVKTLPDKKDKEDFENDSYGVQGIDSRFIAFCRVTEEMRPFYRFELFPDLRELNLDFSSSGFCFGPFVIDGFRALPNLENLSLSIQGGMKGTAFLFTALLELPLLKKFSFSIYYLKNEDWGSLGHFTERQKKIEEFHFGIEKGPSIRASYIQQNASLKRTLQCLGSNFSLKSLHLDFPFASLESLSQGLSHLKITNQVNTFKFKACDDILTSQEKPLQRVEGLCQFIKNQKESLRTLHFDLPLTLEDTVVTHIAEAVSQLAHLKELSFQYNFDHGLNQAFDYYQKTLQSKISPELKKKITQPEEWSPGLASYFKELSSLEKLTLDFKIICTDKTNPSGWFMDVISILPDLEQLKTLQICAISNEGFLRKEKQMLANILPCLPRLKNIAIALYDSDRAPCPEELDIDKLNEEINKKLARKNDYLFY